ncbi:hypothetical protein PHJA_001519000 [Phtheirospermum japonicum]|uniref:ENT domain-containing protein n=1 Tax=Phtheirospermum japonicum TaxID=374723 RepID=A0A830C3V0_9LAMI|nr:hypothetical protein PHJA_001519000 [Phtheirospermum japonicum]
MRLKKGDKVEVTNKDDAPVFWRAAKILSSNGHTYRVQYDSFPGTAGEQMVVTVSRKFVRPGPPLVPGVENCIAGDIVEVFYECAWKMAAILRVLEGKKENKSIKKIVGVENRYLVRLLGCSREIIVGGSNMRMRQIWHDGKWVLIGKSSRAGNDTLISNNPSTSIYHHKTNFQIPQINARAEKKPRNVPEEPAFFESDTIHSRSLKRMTPYGSSIVEAHNGHAKKLRAVEKQREKVVDAVNFISNGCNQTESDDDDECSVGSCSVTDRSPNNFCIPFIPFPCREETKDVCSDAESFYGSGSERKSSCFPLKGELEGRIRRLELHAYRRTLEALYACGPLSWEQEALLTNLRIMLHISNDEHLMELKNLISAKTAINFRVTVEGMHHLLPRLKDDDARVCCLFLLGIILWTINYSRLVSELPFVATPRWRKRIKGTYKSSKYEFLESFSSAMAYPEDTLVYKLNVIDVRFEHDPCKLLSVIRGVSEDYVHC